MLRLILTTAANVEEHDVLVDHRNRSHAVKPPTAGRLRKSGLQQPASVEHNSPSDGESGEGRAHSQARAAPSGEAPAELNLRSSRLAFYYPYIGWVSVLDEAKTKFRLHIVTSGAPFTTMEHDGSFASTCIAEAISDFHRDNSDKPVALDECEDYHLKSFTN